MDKEQESFSSFFIYFELAALYETTGRKRTAIPPDKIILYSKSGMREWRNVLKWPKLFQGHILNIEGKHHFFR